MRALERYLLLQIIDNRWREHLYDMDYLREGIHLRGFAQIEPIVAYKNEAFELFSDLMSSIWPDFARMVFHVEVEVQGEEGAPPPDWTPAAGSQTQGGTVTYSGGADAQPSALSAAAAAGAGTAVAGEYAEEDANGHGAVTGQVVQQRRVDADQAIGRNDPCWCGQRQEVQEVPRRVTAERRTPRRADCPATADVAPRPPRAASPRRDRRQDRRGRQPAEAARRRQAVEHDRGVRDGDAGQVRRRAPSKSATIARRARS